MRWLPGRPVPGLGERVSQADRKLRRGSDAPIMKEEDAGFFMDHMIVDCYNLDVVPNQSTNYWFYFAFHHRKVAGYGCPVGCALKSGPGIESHEAGDFYAMRIQFHIWATDDEAQHSGILLSAMPNHPLNFCRGERT